jgi:orotidine-5'-phosphate decarboxylase
MRDFEYLEISPDKKRLYHAVGDKLTDLAAAHSGTYGYGAFGAVVGCTERDEAAEIRKNYPPFVFSYPRLRGAGRRGG